jgi:hypothetical protein
MGGERSSDFARWLSGALPKPAYVAVDSSAQFAPPKALRVILDLRLNDKAQTDKKKGADNKKLGKQHIYFSSSAMTILRQTTPHGSGYDRESRRAIKARPKVAHHEVGER